MKLTKFLSIDTSSEEIKKCYDAGYEVIFVEADDLNFSSKEYVEFINKNLQIK